MPSRPAVLWARPARLLLRRPRPGVQVVFGEPGPAARQGRGLQGDPAPHRIALHHPDPQLVAHAVAAAALADAEPVVLPVQLDLLPQRLFRNEALDVDFLQLAEEAEVGDAGDDG